MAESTTDPVDDTPTAGGDGRSRLRTVAAVAAIVILLDQITKIWAVAALDDGPIDLFWTFRLRLIYNTGSAFSLGEGFGQWLAVIIVLVVIGVIRYSRQVPGRWARVLLGMIVGGAIGNLIDRAARADEGFLSGGVVDFFDLQWWPVFNVADIGVVCGAIGLLILSLIMPEQTYPSDPSTGGPEPGDVHDAAEPPDSPNGSEAVADEEPDDATTSSS
ncbi:MAG: signal peptidase II [Actinomycetota bacterium]